MRPGKVSPACQNLGNDQRRVFGQHDTAGPDPNDRRGTLVRLTRRGRSVVNRAVETHVGNEERLLAALTAAERRTLDRLLIKLLSELERAEGNP